MPEFMEVCELAARAAGKVLMDLQGRIQVREKNPKDLVTEADIAALHAEMAQPDYYRRPSEQITAGAARLKQWESQLATAYERWEELEQLAD